MAAPFCIWPRFDVVIKGGIATIIKHALAILCWTWTYSEREKKKSWCSIMLIDAKSFCFEGDAIEHV
jgi:hypothetical protein